MQIIKKRVVPRAALLIILIGLLIYSFIGEKLPYNEGMGWDGTIYYSIFKDCSTLYPNHGIDAYHMQRIMPFAFLHYVYKVFGISVTPASAIMGCNIFHFVCILLMVYYLFGISRLKKWKLQTEVIAFAICFFNVPTLKILGYYPMLTDCFATLLAIAGIFYFLKDNKIKLLVAGFLAFLTFPILAFIIWVLAFFPRTEIDSDVAKDDKVSLWLSRVLRVLYTMWLPVLGALLFIVHHIHHPEESFIEIYDRRPAMGVVHAVICLVACAFFFWFATKPFVCNWRAVLAELIKKKNLMLVVGACVSFGLLNFATKYYGGENNVLSPLGQLIVMILYSSSDVLVILETHFFYWGLFFLLLILNWNEIVGISKAQYGIGFVLILMLGLLFITDIETRKLLAFVPVTLIPLMDVLNNKNFKKWVPITFVILSLFLSFFWWKINVPGIEQSFIVRVENYRAFPAQRYYMFMGPWQSRYVYLIVSLTEIVMGALIYLWHRRGYFYIK